MKRNFIALFILITAVYANLIYAQINPQNNIPQRVILNLTATPEKSIAVTWRTVNRFDNSLIEIAESKQWIDFAVTAKKITAKNEKLVLNNSAIVYHYSAEVNELKPNTLYAYRVGHDSVWSEWFQFKTAKNDKSKFEFVYLGDPQTDIKQLVSRTFREAYKKAPGAAFWLFTGDLTDRTYMDNQWDELFYAGGFIFGMVPSVMAPGNHEYAARKSDGTKFKEFTYLWHPHFTLPENGVKGLEETSYYFDYQGTRFFILNGNEKLEEQARWMENLLVNNPNKWTIVAMHQALYSTGRDRDNKEIQRIFLPLYDKYSVDLVLQGDDHTYGRSYKLNNGKKVSDNDKGTVYVVSVSGSKAYPLNPKYTNLMVKHSEKVQLFQVISIDGNNLKFNAYTANDELYDSFELNK
jgi:acid phosphatase type 7